MDPLEHTESRIDVRRELRILKQRFEAAPEHYKALCDSSEKSVVRWLWTTAPRYHLNPLYFLDPEVSVGHIASSPPNCSEGWTAYGFSVDNRVVVERQYLDDDRRGRYYNILYCETHDRILGYYFHYELALGCINCSQLVFNGPYPAFYQKWAIRGWATQTYVTVDGKIRSFTETFKSGDEPEQKLSGEVRYGGDGLIEVWTKWPGRRKSERTFRGLAPAENPFLRPPYQ
jgi:hypothetical protein